VKVYELVKREVNFKESKDGRGIVLKNKKFSFDGTAPVVVDDVQEAEPEVAVAMNIVRTAANGAPVPLLQSVPTRVGQGGNLAPVPVNQKRILFKVTFEPEGQNRFEAERLGFKLTVGKQYPVHRQNEHPLGGMLGSVYWITDDTGKIVDVDEKFFTVVGVGLLGGEEFNRDFQREKQPKLLYDNGAGGGGGPRGPLDRSQIPEQYRNIPIEGEESNDLSAYKMPEIRPGFKP